MELQIVNKQTAEKLKELDFNWSCNVVYLKGSNSPDFLNYYEGDGTGYTTNIIIDKGEHMGLAEVTAPTLDLTIKWLRDVKNIILWVVPIFQGFESYISFPDKFGNHLSFNPDIHRVEATTDFTKPNPYKFDTWEQAQSKGIMYVLILLENGR